MVGGLLGLKLKFTLLHAGLLLLQLLCKLRTPALATAGLHLCARKRILKLPRQSGKSLQLHLLPVKLLLQSYKEEMLGYCFRIAVCSKDTLHQMQLQSEGDKWAIRVPRIQSPYVGFSGQ